MWKCLNCDELHEPDEYPAYCASCGSVLVEVQYDSDNPELTEMINSILEWWNANSEILGYPDQNGYWRRISNKQIPRFVELAQKWSE